MEKRGWERKETWEMGNVEWEKGVEKGRKHGKLVMWNGRKGLGKEGNMGKG